MIFLGQFEEQVANQSVGSLGKEGLHFDQYRLDRSYIDWKKYDQGAEKKKERERRPAENNNSAVQPDPNSHRG